MADDNVSKGGSTIFRHTQSQAPSEFPVGDADALEAISDHIERHIGPISSVFHELASDYVHIDVNHVQPSDDQPAHTLVTSGMSDLPMAVPNGEKGYRFAELLIRLPPSWPVSDADFQDPANYWPVQTLKFLARLPHQYGTWLGADHTVPNSDPPERYHESTRFSGVVLCDPVFLPDEFRSLRVSDYKTVHFYSVVPLFASEMKYKLDQGADALYGRLGGRNITDIVDNDRPNVSPGIWSWLSRWFT